MIAIESGRILGVLIAGGTALISALLLSAGPAWRALTRRIRNRRTP